MSRENDYYWAFEFYLLSDQAGDGFVESVRMNFE